MARDIITREYDMGFNDGYSDALNEAISNLEDEKIEETIDCDDCAYNAGVAACIDRLNKML